MDDSVIKVADVAWVRLRSPDLDVQEQFLTDFGLVRAERTPTALYMRGTDPEHHVHVTELGEPAFLGFAFQAPSEDDLHRLAREPGVSAVEAIDEPGGGKRVRLTEPNGFTFEVVHGVARLDALPVRARTPNVGPNKTARVSEVVRMAKGPSQVKRIGHGVISTPKVDESVAFLRRYLGFIGSDDVKRDDDPDFTVASFNRTDRGDDPVDHHVFMYARCDEAGMNHAGFEVQDIDDVALGHDHLKSTGRYRHVWGLGRHKLGSQVFDYWKDPWGRMHEHWTDSDVFTAADGGNVVTASQGLGSQWGDNAPQEFRTTASR